MRTFILALIFVIFSSIAASAEVKLGFVDMKMVIAKSKQGPRQWIR